MNYYLVEIGLIIMPHHTEATITRLVKADNADEVRQKVKKYVAEELGNGYIIDVISIHPAL